ncbi:MAG: VOC family protein [Armatimonadetes bacterium]|nr:VOC family protein [Armatimonadota bacterium]
MIRGLAHVCFGVSNLDASLAFYCDQLGLKPAFEFINDQGERTGVYVHVGGRNFLELFRGTLKERADGQPYRHLCLEVDDMPATIADLRARGAQVTDPRVGGDRSWQAWTADPDGNRVELHCYTPESRQTPSLK